jgi:hypothetical protein
MEKPVDEKEVCMELTRLIAHLMRIKISNCFISSVIVCDDDEKLPDYLKAKYNEIRIRFLVPKKDDRFEEWFK